MNFAEFVKKYFTSDFSENDFSYVLYPFLRIFKIFGFAPIKLKHGEILKQKNKYIQWDMLTLVRALIGITIQIIGFSYGVHFLAISEKTQTVHDTTIIAYVSSWAQILTLFVLGILAILTSWIYLPEMHQLCTMVYKIDKQFKRIVDVDVHYKQLRRHLIVQMVMSSIIPMSLSMVNCMIIEYDDETIAVISTCYWFICFVPIMLITVKEFQFYNLMFLFKSKYDLINRCLKRYGRTVPKNQVIFVRKVKSVSEIPLTSLMSQERLIEKPDCVTTKQMEAFLDLYCLISDGVDLLMKIFAIHLLLMTTVSFGVITIQSYNVFAMCVQSLKLKVMHVVYIVGWIIIQILVIGVNVSACNETSKSMAATGPLIHKIKLQCQNEPTCSFFQMLQMFSLEVLQRKSQLTAAGFFDMDYKLITSIIGAVTTYLVIFIQFHLTNAPYKIVGDVKNNG